MKRISDLNQYVTSAQTPVRVVLDKFNQLHHQLQLVIDDHGRLLGTVTDGDIRRGFLAGCGLESQISEVMETNPALADGNTEDNLVKIRQFSFLPELDPEGKIRALLLPIDAGSGIDAALVMAGGAGKRLGHRTKSVPKPLLPVGGTPMLEHILSKLENCGVGRIFISVQYLPEKIEEFVAQRESQTEIQLLYEDTPLGTAGALGLLPGDLSQPLLVLNGDVLTRANFLAIDEFHRRHQHDATIGVAKHEVHVPYGVVRHDGTGAFLGIDEKPNLTHFVAAGIYYLGAEFRALVRPGQFLDMPSLLDEGRKLGLQVGLFPILEYWADVGRPQDLDEADRLHSTEHRPEAVASAGINNDQTNRGK